MNKTLITLLTIFSLASCQNKPSQTNAVPDTLKTTTDTTKAKQKFGLICDNNTVSDEFDFQLSGYTPTGDEDDDNHVSLAIISKKDKQLVQTITLEKGAAFRYDCSSFSFAKDNAVKDSVSDGIYGDLVVADFNFDGKEDLAVAFEVGFSEFYNFYLQDNGKFVLNNYLTDSVGLIPNLDVANKTLTTWIREGANRIQIQTFLYNGEKKQFSLLKWWMEDFDGNKLDTAQDVWADTAN